MGEIHDVCKLFQMVQVKICVWMGGGMGENKTNVAKCNSYEGIMGNHITLSAFL